MKRWRAAAGPAQLVILLASLSLIALTWIGTLSALRTEERAAVAHESAELSNKALMLESQLHRQLLAIDQTLRILGGEWERDPTGFDLESWRRRARVFADVALQIYITDANGVIRMSSRPEMVGVVTALQVAFQDRTTLPADHAEMFLGAAGRDPRSQPSQISFFRRLYAKSGGFAGVIGLDYNTAIVGAFFRAAQLGSHGIVELVGPDDGRVYASAGDDRPTAPANLAGTKLFNVMHGTPDGSWTGSSEPGRAIRMYALRRVVDQPLEVILSVDPAQVLSSHYAWQRTAWIFASCTSVFLLVIMAVLLRELRAAGRREAGLAQDRLALEAANTRLASARELAEARSAQLDATLLGISDGVTMVDADMRLVQWNARFAEFTGTPADMLRVGLPMADLLRAQAKLGEFGSVDVEAEVARRMALLRSGSYKGVTERARPNGRMLELRRRSLPTGGFVTLYSDITERKRAEQVLEGARTIAEAVAADKSRFVAIVSHEIRTPLNTLLSALLLLNAGDLPASQRGVLGVARQSGDALLGLLDDILEMSRADAGQLTLRPSAFALHPLLEGVLEIFHDQAAARGIFLGLDIVAGVPVTLYSDGGRLRQVLMNLVSNAVKYSRPGFVVLQAATRMEAGRSFLRLGLRDRGPAIHSADRPRLFQPFSRLEQRSSPFKPGTGLGLVICQRLTALLGGEIGYLEVAQDCNEFWITLPITPVPVGDGASAAHAARPMLPRTRILLVDDIASNRAIIATLLRREGHMVDVAGSGEAAVAAAGTTPYDMVLMDIFMPGMDGLDAARTLRGLGGAPAAVPIVALTANTEPEELASYLAAGMNDRLCKPVNIVDLLAAIARHAWPGRAGTMLPRPEPAEAVSPPFGDAPATQVPAVPALDNPRLADLRANLSSTLLAGLIHQCLSDLAARLPALREALEAGDFARTEAEAHAMAGMAASYAMAAMESRLRRVILAARHRDADTARQAATGLDDDLARTEDALRSIFSLASA